LVNDIRAGDGKIANLFYSVSSFVSEEEGRDGLVVLSLTSVSNVKYLYSPSSVRRRGEMDRSSPASVTSTFDLNRK
jgi:hypothetical protein